MKEATCLAEPDSVDAKALPDRLPCNPVVATLHGLETLVHLWYLANILQDSLLAADTYMQALDYILLEPSSQGIDLQLALQHAHRYRLPDFVLLPGQNLIDEI